MRRELEIRITVPDDDDRKYLNDIFCKGILDFYDYLVCTDKFDIPNTGQQVFGEAVVWWCSRVVP